MRDIEQVFLYNVDDRVDRAGEPRGEPGDRTPRRSSPRNCSSSPPGNDHAAPCRLSSRSDSASMPSGDPSCSASTASSRASRRTPGPAWTRTRLIVEKLLHRTTEQESACRGNAGRLHGSGQPTVPSAHRRVVIEFYRRRG